MATPFKREMYRDPRPRLQQLGARMTQYSNAQRHVLWSAAHKCWVTVENAPRGGFLVQMYRECPCDG